MFFVSYFFSDDRMRSGQGSNGPGVPVCIVM